MRSPAGADRFRGPGGGELADGDTTRMKPRASQPFHQTETRTGGTGRETRLPPLSMLFTLRSFEGGGGKGGREYRRDKDSCHWQCLGWPGTDSLDTWLKHLPRGWKTCPDCFADSSRGRFFGNLARLTTCWCASVTCPNGWIPTAERRLRDGGSSNLPRTLIQRLGR